MKKSFSNYLFFGILCVFFLSLWGCRGSSSTYNSSLGTVQGVVVDSDSLESLPGVAVSVGALKTTTNEEGKYSLSSIPAGIQAITATDTEYDAETDSVQVLPGRAVTKDLFMDSNIEDWFEYGTSYNWQVEAVHADGTVEPGPVWNFTTESQDAQSLPPAAVICAVDAESARKVAETFLKDKADADLSIAAVDSIMDGAGSTMAYLFTLSPAGYVIVPASRADVLPPILAYSFDQASASRKDTPNLLLNLVRLDVQLRLSAVHKGVSFPEKERQKNRTLWSLYLAGKGDPATSRTTMKYYGPLLKTAWHQKAPYYNLCPMDPDPETPGRCLVGCTATAYTQVFNYWKCPNWVTFTADDNYTTRTRGINITATSANFSNLDYRDGNPDDDAKAKLSFACGVLAKMNYRSVGSGADTIALGRKISAIGYQDTSDKRFDLKDIYDPNPMIQNLKMSPGRPVVMAIYKEENGKLGGGHAIVCDGYDETDGSFHLNFGWAGTSWNTWYFFPKDAPAGYNFVRAYTYTISVQPAAVAAQKDPSQSRAGIQSPRNPFPHDGESEVPLDDVLTWDKCDNAVSYKCYLWKAGEQKPSVPTFPRLLYPVADPNSL